jgi:hypothetical protein
MTPPIFDFWDAYIWCAKALLLAVALFLTLAVPGYIIACVVMVIEDKCKKRKFRKELEK